MSKLWGGRFEKQTHTLVEDFTSSIALDARLWKVDIQASVAHARQLGAQKILQPDESEKLIAALSEIEREWTQAGVSFDPKSEDIHSEVERRLFEKLGPLAGKLHTARSRNDQVITDTRLYLREEISEICKALRELQRWIVEKAPSQVRVILPGLTHTQHAQPVSLAHHLMAYFWMLERDHERLVESRKRVDLMPLGSAALAGTSFALDRPRVASELGFQGLCENSLDAVSDRDFIIEFLSSASMIMMHLSRWSDELILWSTPEFNFIKLDDSVTTGSSIMPQKKNPDVAELIRGKVGRVYGALMGALTMMKGLPLSYHRDLQEDKTFLFEGIDTAKSSLKLMKLMLETAEFQTESMEQKVQGDFSNATDLADDLVVKGLSFREAHEVVGGIVKHCLSRKCSIEDLTLSDLQRFSPLFRGDIVEKVKPKAVLESRTSRGGTGSNVVLEQIQMAKELLES